MTVQDMHYDFKRKLNKIDSQKYRNLQVQEIDWVLNESQILFIRTIAEPRIKNQFGFEINQRTIDDIRTVVVDNFTIPFTNITGGEFVASIPNDYFYYASSEVFATKGACLNKKMELITVRQHDDRFEDSVFDKSNFEWREVNLRFFDGGIKGFAEDFILNNIRLNYIKKPKYIHYAQGTTNNTYNLPDGTTLTGIQNCELPEITHYEIVDLAVMIATGDIQSPDLTNKINKYNLNN